MAIVGVCLPRGFSAAVGDSYIDDKVLNSYDEVGLPMAEAESMDQLRWDIFQSGFPVEIRSISTKNHHH